jgi:outer membrane protein TolC
MFEIGRGDSFSMSDAEDTLLQARNRMLAAQSEVSLAAYRLMKTLGTLIEYPADLKPKPDFTEGGKENEGKQGR